MAITAEQQALVGAVHAVLERDGAIEAAWLAGSLGRGGGDAFSDVDVLVLTGAGAATETGRRYARDIGAIATPALVNALYGGRVVSVVTVDWRRFDLSFVEPAELGRYDDAQLTPLFNRGENRPPRGEAKPYRTTPEVVLPLVKEYLRVLGLLVVAVGREEWLLALSGLDILRRLTIDLMLEENGVSPAERGGAQRRNPFLTADQRRALEGLSPVAATRDSVIAANVELARVFLPLARRLGGRIGMEWPGALEEATKRHLRERLNLEIDETASGPGPALTSRAKDEAEILRLDDAWNDAYRRRDRAPLAQILADDFSGLAPSGEAIGKAALMVDPPGAVNSIAFSEQAVQVFGDTAVSRGRLQLEVDERRIDQRFLRVFARRDGVWRAVSVAVTPIAA